MVPTNKNPNLIGMGVLPLQFKDAATRKTLHLDGNERFDIRGIKDGMQPRMDVNVRITRANGPAESVVVRCRIDTLDEVAYHRHGGILHFVLRTLRETER